VRGATNPCTPRAPVAERRVHEVRTVSVASAVHAASWQIRQRPHELNILVAAPGPDFDATATETASRRP
jgi:hypothetical protein